MKPIKISIIVLLILQSALSYAQTEQEIELFYYEECLPSEIKKHDNDTIYDRFIVFNIKDLEMANKLILNDESGEVIYQTAELLSGQEGCIIKGNKLYINIGKADQFTEFQIQGDLPNKGKIYFKDKKTKKTKTSHSEVNNKLVKKYDIKAK